MFENWRFNPFTGTMHAVLIENEAYIIEYHADFNSYGIQLNEAPRLDNPSTVAIVEDVTGGSTFSELPRTQVPATGQYRVDYDALTYYGTGRVEFAAADVGKKVLVSYYGTGWTVKNHYPMGQTTIPTNLEVTEDVDVDGNLTLTGDNTGKGDLSVAGDADIIGALEVDGGITGDLVGNADTADIADGIKETGTGAGVLHFKIIEIGDWDMDATSYINIPDELIYSKIRTIHVEIRNDADTDMSPIDYNYYGTANCGGYRIEIREGNATSIILSRTADKKFDSMDYNSTSYNRGYITIGYID